MGGLQARYREDAGQAGPSKRGLEEAAADHVAESGEGMSEGPGFEGKFELGFFTVPDPFEPDKVLTIACNVRHDIVLQLYNRRKDPINFAQFRAGNYILHLIEQTEESRGLVCDPAKEPVDGGRGGQELSDNRARAARRLKGLARCLDSWRPGSYHMARSLIANGVSFGGYGFVGRRHIKVVDQFIEVLTEAARHFTYDSVPCTCSVLHK